MFLLGATLVVSGIAISKINTDYMETGERVGKIVAERASRQISVTTHEGLQITGESDPEVIDKRKILNYNLYEVLKEEKVCLWF